MDGNEKHLLPDPHQEQGFILSFWKKQWKLHIVITLGQRETDKINRMITIRK
jgi:hypothetical protein